MKRLSAETGLADIYEIKWLCLQKNQIKLAVANALAERRAKFLEKRSYDYSLREGWY